MSSTDEKPNEPGGKEAVTGSTGTSRSFGTGEGVSRSGETSSIAAVRTWSGTGPEMRTCADDPEVTARMRRRESYQELCKQLIGGGWMIPPDHFSAVEQAFLRNELGWIVGGRAEGQAVAVYISEDGEQVQLALQMSASRLSEGTEEIIRKRRQRP